MNEVIRVFVVQNQQYETPYGDKVRAFVKSKMPAHLHGKVINAQIEYVTVTDYKDSLVTAAMQPVAFVTVYTSRPEGAGHPIWVME
jgi:hypothetical protein